MSRSTDARQNPPKKSPLKKSLLGVSNTTLSLIVIAVFVAVAAIVLFVARTGSDTGAASPGPVASATAVRPDSHRLSEAPGSTVTFVEFLDFECEACGAAYPSVEELRKRYGDRVTFVMRYFPLPSHFNAERAARAVEAAAQQGLLEPMYKMMYETQEQWGEQQIPVDSRFRGYAMQLGLDMARWDAAYTSPATLERINADRADGYALGVQGTPSFFVNGKKIQVRSGDDLTRALDDALAGR